MLSNPNISKFSNQIRVSTLVVDEASQIEIGNYVSIFASFKASLRKACFIGDDKQCKFIYIEIDQNFESTKFFLVPPYGQEDLQDLQSIFEVPHLRTHALFLNTQCKLKSFITRSKISFLFVRPHASPTWQFHFRACLC